MPTIQDIVKAAQSNGIAPTESEWQLAQDQAEQQRNYINTFNGAGTQQNQGTSGSEGGGGVGPSQLVYNNLPTGKPTGPDAYGLNGIVNGQEFEPGGEAELAATLARVRQFDPSATFSQHTRTTGGEGGGTDQTYYTLDFDQSKLPKPRADGLVTVGGYGRDHLYNNNDSALLTDPHYGVMSSPLNVKPDDRSFLDYAPLLVGLIGTVLSGGAASPLLATMLQAPRTLASIGDGGNPLAALLSLAGGATGIPGGSVVGSLIGNSINKPGGP